MSEEHRLSYVGDPHLVESFMAILARHNLVHISGDAAPPPIEPGMDYDASDPFSIVASGSHDTGDSDIADAIAEFAGRYPGRARISDGGAMPSGGTLAFRGRRELLDDLCRLLVLEQVEVLDPEPDDDWASVDDQIEADPAEEAAVELRVLGWGDLRRPVAAAVAAFRQRHPGFARIDFDSGDP